MQCVQELPLLRTLCKRRRDASDRRHVRNENGTSNFLESIASPSPKLRSASQMPNDSTRFSPCKKWDDKHRLFKRFKTRSAPEYFAIRVK
jgi:hypothetical protein